MCLLLGPSPLWKQVSQPKKPDILKALYSAIAQCTFVNATQANGEAEVGRRNSLNFLVDHVDLLENNQQRQSRQKDRKFATLRGFRKASKPPVVNNCQEQTEPRPQQIVSLRVSVLESVLD